MTEFTTTATKGVTDYNAEVVHHDSDAHRLERLQFRQDRLE
jgi:hypothetical protein